jgi:hypothetical protein
MERFENAYGVRPGILRKAWQATNDTRTRHTHHEADGQTVMVTEPFIVGGAPLAFPGDPTGPPQEVINCRCANLVLFDPADLNLDDIPAELTLNAAAYEEVTVPLRDDTVITAAVRRTGWDSLPVAPDTHPWDGPGAAERIARDCGIDDTDVTPDDTADAWACYASAFLYRDDNADERTKGAYKLGVLDIVDGRRQLVPRGVFAVAGVLRGARGGADIPAEQQRELRSAVAGLYDHINEELDTDHVVPWDDDDDRSASLSFAADVPPGPTSDNPRYARVSGEIVVGNRATGDRREFDTDNLTWQNVGATTASLEIPLGYQYERGHGPGGADKVARVGRLDSIERRGDRLFARGVVDLRSPRGLEAARQMGTRDNPGTLAGVSIIIDEDPDGPGFAVEYQFAEGCESPEEAEFNAECMEPTRTVITDGARIRAVDLVDIPAFAEARLYLDEELPEDIEEPAEVLTASSYTITIPDLPPADWFEEPKEAPEIGAITVTEDGRFFGYLAPKKVAHRGFRDKRVTVPTGNVDYGIWMNRATLVDDGRGGYTKIATGPITMDCGHAPATSAVTGPARREHYDNACSVVATARVGENRFGVWIAGALIPGVNGEQVARMMACQLSGDWGPHREKPGKRELAAALLVPVPGFPTAHHSFTLQNGELSRTVTPVRFGVYAGVDEPVGMRAAADLMARQLGCDQETRLREFALSLRETLKG